MCDESTNLRSSAQKINNFSKVAGLNFPRTMFLKQHQISLNFCAYKYTTPLKIASLFVSTRFLFSFCFEICQTKRYAKMEWTCKSFLFRLNYMHINK